MSFDALIVAAGSGTRSGGPKQWSVLGGKPLVRWSVEAFRTAGAARMAVVIPAGTEARLAEALAELDGWIAVTGGTTRSASVRAGLEALPGKERPVLIHDAARPLVTAHHVQTVLRGLDGADGALPALPVSDTLKRGGDVVEATVSRDRLWRAQTPQGFDRAVLDRAWAAWRGDEPTDDAAVVEAAGGRVVLVAGDPRLMKVTYPEDFAMAEAMLGRQWVTRTGLGLDAHRWGPGEGVWLCGVQIAHDQSLIGHSDADAGLHALTDAILGALGEGDIGDHFPPSDPRWKGVASDLFLRHAVERVSRRGGRLVGLDVTLVCERPRIGPHRQAMRERLADITGLPVEAIGVKATTTEGLGFTGRGEGLMAQAVASVELPRS